VYVKGHEKREWLADIVDDAMSGYTIQNLDVIYEDIPTMNKLDPTHSLRCNKHITNCALQNVFKIFNWWSQRQKEL